MTAQDFISRFLDASPTVEVKTSGSTGTPKLMLVEKSRMLASARMTCDFLGLKEGDTALLCMSLDYIAGKMMVVRSLERKMNLIEISPSGHPFGTITHPQLYQKNLSELKFTKGSDHLVNFSSVKEKGEKEEKGEEKKGEEIGEITFAAIVPLQLYNTLQEPLEKEKLMKVRHVIVGGGAIDDAVESELRSFPNAVWSTYGMTETLSHIAMRRLSGKEASLWYTPLGGVMLSQDGEGCLIINAPALNPETLHTNDIVELRADGAFRVIGRRDNVICSGGIKLQIEDIERQLRPHLSSPFVITKAPDKKFGEVVVLLTEGEESEAQQACESLKERFSRPKHIIHVASIPLTETGKPARAEAAKIASACLSTLRIADI